MADHKSNALQIKPSSPEVKNQAHMPGQWTAADYELSARIHDAAEEITKRLTEHAVRLAITRFDLLSFDPDARDDANTEDEIVDDIQGVALGEETGCLDPDSLDATNCEVLFVEAELRKLAPVPIPRPNAADLLHQRDELLELIVALRACDSTNLPVREWAKKHGVDLGSATCGRVLDKAMDAAIRRATEGQ